MTITANPPNSTAPIRRQLADLRQQRTQERATTTRLRELAMADPTDERTAALVKSANLGDELTSRIEALEEQERGMLGRSHHGGQGSSSSFLDSTEALAALERFATSSHPIGRQELGTFMSAVDATSLTGKALAAVPGFVDPTGGMERGQFGGIIPAPTPPTTFLDACPSATLDGPSMPYAQEVLAGDRTAGAAPVEPGQIKPMATIEYVDAEAKPETVAAWSKVQKASLADVDTLAARIQSRLLTGVRAAVENQVLTGDGVSPNLLGLLNVPGTIPVPFDAAAVAPDAILDGIAACLTTGANPNIVALSIEDWTAILKSKSAGSQEYLGSPFLAPASSLWSLPMVPCVGVPPGQAIVADTRIALTVLWREGIHVLVSDADQDDFVRNRATLLAETRVALAVWVPSAIAIVDLTGTGTATAGRGGGPKSK